MQSIERYGVIALLFLVVTVVAVLMWDTEDHAQDSPVARADQVAANAPQPAAGPAQRGPITDESRLEARTEPGPARSAREPVGERERPAWADGPETDELEEAPNESGEPEQAGALADDALQAQAPAALDGARTIAAERTSPREEREAAPAAGARPKSKSERLHLVRAGDTLGEIAQSALGSSRRWPEIAALNPGLDPSNLRVGMRIVLPDDAGAAKASAAAAKSSVAAGEKGASQAQAAGRTYRVRAGDSLWRIAERELGDGDRWRELVAANRGLNPDKLLVGTVLAVPGKAPAARAAGETVAKASEPKADTREAKASPRKGRVQ